MAASRRSSKSVLAMSTSGHADGASPREPRIVADSGFVCWSGARLGAWGVDAGDVGADALQLFYYAFVAAVYVVDAVDDGFAVGDQGGEDQAGAGAEVGGLHGGAGKFSRAADYGAAAVDGNVGAHADHLAGVEVAVLEDRFGDDGSSFGLGGEGHVLGLHVGGEAGIFLGGDVGADKFSCRPDTQRGFIEDVGVNASLLQLGNDRAEMIGCAVSYGQIAASDGARDQERACFDAIGDHGVLGAMEFLCAANAQGGRAVACDAGSHVAQHDDEIGDFRFAGGVLQDGFAIGEDCGHKDIFRAGDRDFVEDDVGALKAAAIWNFGFDVAMRNCDFGSHFFESREMQIDWPGTDGTASGERNVGDAEAGH